MQLREQATGQRSPVRDFVTDPRRKSPRREVRIAGEFSTGDRHSRQNCAIVDMSATGARLQIATTEATKSKAAYVAPRRRIGLFFDFRHTSVECQIIWVRENLIGVRFCSAFTRSQTRL